MLLFLLDCFKTLQVCQEGNTGRHDGRFAGSFKTLQVCQEDLYIKQEKKFLICFKTLQVCQEVRTLRPTGESTCKFQNLIGMLGSLYYIIIGPTITMVSKPYRYARKMQLHIYCSIVHCVSKPYRYARKQGSGRSELVQDGFQNLIGMLGSHIRQVRRSMLKWFQNLIGMLGRIKDYRRSFVTFWFQNLIGMLGSWTFWMKSKVQFRVSKPYRYARKENYFWKVPIPKDCFKTLQVCQEG